MDARDINKRFDWNKPTFPEVVIFFLIATTPLVSVSGLLDTKLLPRGILQGVALLLLIGYSIAAPQKKEGGFLLKHFLWIIPFILFYLSYLLSSLHTLNHPEAVHWGNKTGLTMVAVIVVLFLSEKKYINFKIIALAVLTGVTISIILFTVEIFLFDFQKHTIHELSTPFAHKNLFASYLALSLPFIVYLVFESGLKGRRIFAAMLSLATIAIILYLRSKTAMAAILAGGIIAAVPFTRRYQLLSKILLTGIFISIFAIAALLILSPDLLTPVFDTGSFKERLIVWNNTLEMIRDNFIYGVGGGNWQIFFPKYRLHEFYDLNNQVYLGYETFQRPHNDYLWVFSEAGIVGFISYISILLIPVTDFIINKRWKSGIIAVNNLMFAGLIIYFVLALSDFSIERFEHQFMMVLLYVYVIPHKEEEQGIYINPIVAKIMMIILMIMTLGVLANFFYRARAESNHRRVLSAHSSGNWTEMYIKSDQTDESIFSIDNFSIPVIWYKGVAASSMGNHSEALRIFRRAAEINPYQVHVLNNLAGSYQQTGDSRKALYYYQKALEISPLHYEVLLNKSITELNTGDTTEAFQTLLGLIYKKEHPQTYHTAMPIIFNAYLESLRSPETIGSYNQKSISNLMKSDSLKIVFLYHYQIDHKPTKTLLNEFIMDIPQGL